MTEIDESIVEEEETPFYRNWRELIRPSNLELDKEKHTERYGKFICQPLERGFATTLGNCLRRVLLSSVQGVAITAIKIEGALHEFSTLTGVIEDVTEIILNLKGVRFKVDSSKSKIVTIDKSGKGNITAADIKGDHNIEVMNPEQHICTITSDINFSAEFLIEWGKGYCPAEKHNHEDLAVGFIPIDSTFTPITNVKFIVNQARVGQQTDYDKLTLEISGDGSVPTENALAYAAKIIKTTD